MCDKIIKTISVICLVVIIIISTYAVTRDSIRVDAIRAGVAHYVITDKENPVCEFQWITNNISTNK